MANSLPRRVLGIDFSGASGAGRKIWIAEGQRERRGLRITACYRAESLPGSGRLPAECLPALRRLIAGLGSAIVGCDFPFTLPAPLLTGHDNWSGFLRTFDTLYPDAGAFRAACAAAAQGHELRRACEVAVKAPFCSYNLRLYRQTYAGIGAVLAPLVSAEAVSVLPFQRASPGRPWLLEVCPASTLKRLGLYLPYKGRGESLRDRRAFLLEALAGQVEVALPLRASLVDDPEGDALDSVIAALAAVRLDHVPKPDPETALEGAIYC